ncbi:P-loop containing nucleoside triphosphate hydrolase protein [Pilobolus umbonatus]|nr:P-loop containing nucleoside triphosphate hydrolase protein [Pilobolus umbonatus]
MKDFKIVPYAFVHTIPSSPAAAVLNEEIVEEIEVEVKKRFDSLEAIHPTTQKALAKVFKYDDMSTVQEAVLTKLPNKKDMFVKAKTGTGKTLAFLVAALETAMEGKTPQDLKYFDGASIFIVSPTRELANQIAEEADKLTTFSPYKVHCFVGGDSKRRSIMNLERRRCDIIVGTPGRLNDMLESVPRFKKMVENVKVLILDEADQLLDMGFKTELQRILSHLPDQRQTMLYSATISPEIKNNLGKFALSPEYDLIDTVGHDEVNTNVNVKQSAIIAPYSQQVALLRHTLETNEAARNGKVIVFLPTTKSTMVYAHVFKQLLGDRMVYEIHSKKNQDQRSRIADRFRKSRDSSILFTSDVSARGVDYPGVSLVVQVGVPSTREQYIHRLGRTGRAGREGEGIILLAPFEKSFLHKEIADLPVEHVQHEEHDKDVIQETTDLVSRSIRSMDEDMVREVYTAYLGYYSSRIQTLGYRRTDSLTEAGNFMQSLGITDLPHLSPRFLTQLGLSGGGGGGGFSRNSSRGNGRDSFRSFDRNDRSDRPRSFDRSSSRSFDRRDSKPFDRENRSFGNRSFDRDSKPFDRENRSFGDRSFGDKSFGDKSFGDKPFGDRSFDKKPFERRGNFEDKPFRRSYDRNDKHFERRRRSEE